MSVESILESIEKLTLLEAAELVKAMEEKFGVSAAAPVAVAAASGGAANDAPTEVSVILADAGGNKVVDFFENPLDKPHTMWYNKGAKQTL